MLCEQKLWNHVLDLFSCRGKWPNRAPFRTPGLCPGCPGGTYATAWKWWYEKGRLDLVQFAHLRSAIGCTFTRRWTADDPEQEVEGHSDNGFSFTRQLGCVNFQTVRRSSGVFRQLAPMDVLDPSRCLSVQTGMIAALPSLFIGIFALEYFGATDTSSHHLLLQLSDNPMRQLRK